jgi:hypothetical protein
MSVMGWILVSLCLAIVNTVAMILDLQSFLSSHQTIDSAQGLGDFKHLVRRQMYQSLGQLGLLYASGLIFLFGLIGGLWRTSQIVILVALVGVVVFASRMARDLKEQARSLTSPDKGLASLYTAIAHVWRRKSLPDF